ncbi:MAG TPA: hypothetical protein VHU44_03295 [Acidobacteriaceae bacterium]|jgi:hypothetical protein|nr:hypothetical protein [Acidobacteriaceae bacterium]
MKRLIGTLLVFSAPLLPAAHAEQLIPAGSVMQCVISEPNISSAKTQIGDPILCQVSHAELYGRSTFPYGSYLVGHFEAYKDPGHFVGTGWMELKFDRIVVGNDTTIPITSRVVATSDKYAVDKEGRIHGTGHAVRDTVEWMIPILWPIDIINLPRRGPRAVLKPETRLTVKLLDDLGVPTKDEVQHIPELVSRFNYADPNPSAGQQQPAPIERQAPPAPAPQPVAQQAPAPIQQAYAQPPSNPTVIVVQAPAPQTTIIQQPAPTIIQQQSPQVVMPQPAYYPYPYYYPRPRAYYPYGYYGPY